MYRTVYCSWSAAPYRFNGAFNKLVVWREEKLECKLCAIASAQNKKKVWLTCVEGHGRRAPAGSPKHRF